MFCTNCGKKIPDGSRFCTGCGAPVSDTTQAVVQAAQQPAPEPAVEQFVQQPVPEPAVEQFVQQPVPEPAVEQVVQQPAPEPAVEQFVQQPVPEPAVEQFVQQPAPEPAVEQFAQQPAPLPEADFSQFAVPNEPPKKKKKKIGGLIAAISAAVVIGGGAAVGYFCFSNQISRLFKGDAGFAADLEKQTTGFFAGKETDNAASDEMVSAMISSVSSTFKSMGGTDSPSSDAAAEEWGSVYSEGQDYISKTMSDAASSVIPYLKEIAEKTGDMEMRSGISVSVGGMLDKLLGEYSGTVADAVDIINKSSIAVRTAHGENCDVITLSPELDGKSLFDINAYTDWKNIVINAPKLTDYYFGMEIPAELLETSGESAPEELLSFSPEELRRILDSLLQIYYDAFKEAKITFNDGTFAVAGTQVEGSRVSVVFTARQIKDIQQKIFDFLKNDEYLRSWYTDVIGGDIAEYEKMFTPEDTGEDDGDKEMLEVRSYIAAHGKLLAKEYLTPGKDDLIAFVRSDSEIRFVIYTDGGGELSVVDSKSGENSGTVELTYREKAEAAALVLELIYKDAQMSEFKGVSVPTGSFTLKFSDKDEFIDKNIPSGSGSASGSGSGSSGDNYLSKDLMSVSGPDFSGIDLKQIVKGLSLNVTVSQSEDKSDLRTELTLNITDYIGLTSYCELKPRETQSFSMPAMSGDKYIGYGDEVSRAKENEITADIARNLLAILKENKDIADICDKLGINISEMIEKAIAESEEKSEIYRHYSDYKEYSSGWEADQAASDIFEAYEKQFMDWGYSAGEEEIAKYVALAEKLLEEPTVVKVYYDKDGKAAVIDDCGFDFIDFDKLPEYSSYCRKAYCEIVIDPTNASSLNTLLTGVCVVYTDDPSDLPSGLPTTYNYIDQLYEWENNDSTAIKNGFVIGTYPKLYYGISTAKERLEEEKEQAIKAAAEFDADLAKLNIYAQMLAGVCNQFLPNMLSGPEDSSMSYTGSDENSDYYDYYDDHEFLWNTYSVAVSFTDGKWKIDDILIGNSSGISPEQITDGELFESGGKFESYLNGAAARIISGEEVKAELIIWNGEFAGLIIAYADSGVDFTEYNVPGEYDIVLGYFMDWSRYSSYNDAVAGKYYLDYDKYVPLGSWCSCTEAPLTVYPPSSGGYSDEALNDIAGLIYEKTAPYFEDKGKLISSDSTYAVSILHTNYSDLSDWYVIMISDGDRGIESMDEEKMEEFSNFLNDERELDEAVNIYAMLYFCDGELVGVLAMDADDTWMIDDYDQLPLAEEMAEGVYEPKGVNAAFGTWCIANEGPVFNYYQY